jgi:hypothetical protein
MIREDGCTQVTSAYEEIVNRNKRLGELGVIMNDTSKSKEERIAAAEEVLLITNYAAVNDYCRVVTE